MKKWNIFSHLIAFLLRNDFGVLWMMVGEVFACSKSPKSVSSFTLFKAGYGARIVFARPILALRLWGYVWHPWFSLFKVSVNSSKVVSHIIFQEKCHYKSSKRNKQFSDKNKLKWSLADNQWLQLQFLTTKNSWQFEASEGTEYHRRLHMQMN